MAVAWREKVTVRKAIEKEHLTYCKLYCYIERISTLERAILSLHFAYFSIILLCARSQNDKRMLSAH